VYAHPGHNGCVVEAVLSPETALCRACAWQTARDVPVSTLWAVVDRPYSCAIRLPAHGLSRIQNQLLHSPVVHIRDENNVLGWARQPMRPVELFGPAA